MALIVEDGTGLANADSYISLDDARVYAANYGYTLPEDDTEADIVLRQGALYVDLSESSFTGNRLNDTQALAWPRSGAYYCRNGSTIDIASDVIPNAVKYAQVIAASSYAAGVDPRGNYTGRITTSETVGPISVDYADSSSSGELVEITKVKDMLRPLLCNSSSSGQFRTLRV